MKKFLLFVMYFLLILIGLNLVLFTVSKKIYSGNYQAYSLNYNSYLFADSHGSGLNDATESYGIYNFSYGGDSYFDMYRKIEFLIDKIRIDTIYITADDHSLSLYREKANNADRSNFFATLKTQSSYYDYFKIRYLKTYTVLFQPRTRSVIRHYITSTIKSLPFSDKLIENDNVERPWQELSVADRFEKSRNRQKYQYPSKLASAKLKLSLCDIINTCKANNIVLIGVKFPLSIEYNKLLGDKTYGADNILKSSGFMVIDYRKLYNNHDRYFVNQDHLNNEGGIRFAEILFNAN